MKLIHVLTDSNVGGAGILLESLLRHTGLPKKEILVVLPQGAAMARRYVACGVRVLAEMPVGDRAFSLRNTFFLFRLFLRERPALVHTHAAAGAKIAARAAGVRHILATRHCAFPVRGRWWKKALFRIFDALFCSGTVATAHAAADNLREMGMPARKIAMIRNGAEALMPLTPAAREAGRRQLGLGDGDFLVGMVARLHPVKGHDTLFEAAKRLISQHTGWHFLLIGGGQEEERLRRLAAEEPFVGRVHFAGFCERVEEKIGLCDAAVNCSHGTETSCLALSEAMSLGLPCVASNFGGNPEMVREGENGLLFPVGDAAALAEALLRLREEKGLYKRLSVGAKQRFFEEFRAGRMAAAYDALWRETVASGWQNAVKKGKPCVGC